MASLAVDRASIRVVRDMARIDLTRRRSGVLAGIVVKIDEQEEVGSWLQQIRNDQRPSTTIYDFRFTN